MKRALVVLVVLLAGCSGVAPPTTPSPTVTPAPVPAETPTPTPASDRFPAGVTVEGGVTEPWDLTTRSEELLSARNRTVRVVEQMRYANGTTRWRLERVARIGDDRSFVVETHRGEDRPGWAFAGAERVAVFTVRGSDPTEARAYWAITDEGATRYETFDNVGQANSRTLFQLLSRFETRVTGRVVRNGTTLYRIEAEGRGEPQQMKYADRTERARNLSLSLLVDRRGVIHRWHVAYTLVEDGREVRYARTEQVSAVGSTTVETPPWVERLRNESTPTPADPGGSGAET